ncbi:hypothetical protein HDU78_009553 [Chytriomyces hyalinus]|nr:hypothetical protein HDU78_009553 [Chytriomyces hyalinus]
MTSETTTLLAKRVKRGLRIHVLVPLMAALGLILVWFMRLPADEEARLWEARQSDINLATETPLEAALRILDYAPVIDTHNDLPIRISAMGALKDVDLTNLPISEFQTDITRLRQGRVGAQFWSAYVPCSDFTKQTDSVRATLDQIDTIKRIVRFNSDHFEFARNVDDIKSIVRRGKIASLIGIEGAHQIDASMGALRAMYELGVRYMTLTHTCHSAWADSCQGEPVHGGLTTDGHRFVREMNRLGMLVDISHVSAETMKQTIMASKAPVIFSHSSAFAMTPVPRNVPDDILKLLPDRDGVVQINFINGFLSRNGTGKAGLFEIADHIEHIRNLVGAKHIGLGADFDGGPINDFALRDVSKYPDLIAELIHRGFSEKEIVGINGGNLLRVMGRVERVASAMQAAGAEMEEVGMHVQKQHTSTALPTHSMQLAEIRVLTSFLRQCMQSASSQPPVGLHASSATYDADIAAMNPALVALVAQSLPPFRAAVSEHAGAVFADALATRLASRLSGHWHPESPWKGSAYRSISFVNGKPDSLLDDAAREASVNNLSAFFPSNVTFWIDPGHVSFRITDRGTVMNIWGQDASIPSHPVHTQPYDQKSHAVAIRSAKSASKLSGSPVASALPPSPPHLSRQQLRQLKIQQKQSELQEMARSLSNQYSNLYNQQFPNLSSSVASSPSLVASSAASPVMSPGGMSMMMAGSPPQSPPLLMKPQLTVSSYANSSPSTSSSSSPSSPSPSPKKQPHNEYLYEHHHNSNEAIQQYSQQHSYFYNQQQQQQQQQHLNQQAHQQQNSRKRSNGNNKKQNARSHVTGPISSHPGAHAQSWRHGNNAGNSAGRATGGKTSSNGNSGYFFNGPVSAAAF